MEELIANKRIRCNFSDEDMKFFAPKQPSKRTERKVSSKHMAYHPKQETKKEPRMFTLSLRFISMTLLGIILVSSILGWIAGEYCAKQKYASISHYQESLIRSEAIADYKAQVAEQEAEEAAIRMEELKDEAARRQNIVIYFTKLFEGVRDWGFDTRDLVTYAVCVYNRVNSPLFANTIDEVIHQENQWINYSDNNDVVADYKKLAEKVVDLLYNSDIQLCSSKYCWIEIQDGRLYLKDSYNPYAGMILWRYSEDI